MYNRGDMAYDIHTGDRVIVLEDSDCSATIKAVYPDDSIREIVKSDVSEDDPKIYYTAISIFDDMLNHPESCAQGWFKRIEMWKRIHLEDIDRCKILETLAENLFEELRYYYRNGTFSDESYESYRAKMEDLGLRYHRYE